MADKFLKGLKMNLVRIKKVKKKKKFEFLDVEEVAECIKATNNIKPWIQATGDIAGYEIHFFDTMKFYIRNVSKELIVYTVSSDKFNRYKMSNIEYAFLMKVMVQRIKKLSNEKFK